MNDELFFEYDKEFEKSLEDYNRMKTSGRSVYFDTSDIAKIAIHYQVKREFNEALDAVGYGLELHPEKEELQLIEASVLLDLGRLKEAGQLISRFADPDSFDVQMLRVKEAVAGKDILRAKGLLERMENEFPPSEDFFLKAAYCFYDKGMVQSAITWFEKAFGLGHPSLYDLTQYRNCCAVCQKFDKIISYYKDIVDESPYNALAWMGLSEAYLMCRQPEKALESIDFAQTIKANKGTKAIKATALYELQEYEKALEIYLELHKESPDDAPLANFVGMAYYAMGQYDEAITYFNESLRLNPNPPVYDYGMELYYQLALCYRMKGDTDNTLKAINNLLDYPLIIDEGVYFLKAEMELYKGNFEEAGTYFNEGLECKGFEDTNQYITLFFMYQANESLEQLIPFMEKVAQDMPDNPLPLATLFIASNALHREKEAAAYREQLDRMDPEALNGFFESWQEYQQQLDKRNS